MTTTVFEAKWWYRLLKVLYILSGIILLSAGMIIATFFLKQEFSTYQFQTEQHKRSEEIKSEARVLLEEYGSILPVIDSLQNISNVEKGSKAYGLTKKTNSGLYYIDSKNFNGYHYLEPDQEKKYLELNNKIKQGLSLETFSNQPQNPQDNIIRIIALLSGYLAVVLTILWLTRRVFFYIVTGDKFFKL